MEYFLRKGTNRMFHLINHCLRRFFIPRYVVQKNNLRYTALILGNGGWFTTNAHNVEMLFDYQLAKMLDTPFETRDYSQIAIYIHKKYPKAVYNGVEDLYLRWVEEDSVFVIGMEYVNGIAGNEFVVHRPNCGWIRT